VPELFAALVSVTEILMIAPGAPPGSVHEDAIEIVCKGGLADEYATTGARCDVDCCRGKAENLAIFNDDACATQKSDAVDAGADAVEAQIAKRHCVISSRLDDNAIRSGYQNRCHLTATAVDGNRLGYGEGAKSTRIESVNFATGRGLEIAPANVLHGDVREHGLASSPTPDTQVRVAWA
jgi:hypothetical protein